MRYLLYLARGSRPLGARARGGRSWTDCLLTTATLMAVRWPPHDWPTRTFCAILMKATPLWFSMSLKAGVAESVSIHA